MRYCNHLSKIEISESTIVSIHFNEVVVRCDGCMHICGEREGTGGVILQALLKRLNIQRGVEKS